MILYSEIELYNNPYILVTKFLKSKSTWFLYSRIHPSELFIHPSERKLDLLTINDLLNGTCEEYLSESISCTFSNNVQYYKKYNMLLEILDAMNSAKNYGYTKDEKLIDDKVNSSDGILSRVSYSSHNCYYKESKIGKVTSSLSFRYGSIEIDFTEIEKVKLPSLEYQKMDDDSKLKVVTAINIESVSFENLLELVPLDWYYENGEFKRNYSHVDTVPDFESKVINPMIKEIFRCMKLGIPCLIGLDTETDGLNFHYLNENNPTLNKCVSIQLSWDKRQGVNVYVDMAYFDNCPLDYVMKRLADLFRWDRGKFIYKLYYDDEGNKLERPTEILLDRDWYLVGGHNFIFDSKVFRRHGHVIYFDEDTLQMAFTIAPTSFKLKKDLKSLTTKMLGIVAPTLSDLLGKGNEDKFRYLGDTRVADLYGCADVDMFREVWFKLRELMGHKLYKSYKSIDSYTLNLLAESEYYGLRVNKDYIVKKGLQIKEDIRIIEEKIYEFTGKLLLMKMAKATGETYTQEQFDRAQYRFKISGKELITVFYNYLEYPIKVYTEKGEPALNSYAIDKLLYHRNSTPSDFLKQDVLSTDGDPNNKLIDKEKFNSYKYPMAYLIKQHRTLNKEYTGYYKPFMEEDTEDRIFRPIKPANIETRRIACGVQTVKKDIKKCIISHEDDWNLGDWDLAQVEARVFVSLAGDKNMIERMKDPDKDYHTENAALINNVPAHLVPKDMRNKAKAIGFGVPYGLSDFKLCERMFTNVTPTNMIATREILEIFENKNHLSMEELKSYRMKAHDIVEISDDLRSFLELEKDAPVSMIKNAHGFYRYQDMTLALADSRKMASVERAYGNFPIQSFAADFYKVLLCRLHKRIRKEGLQDKVIFHMYIHDELLFSFHKSVDPKYIVKLIKEECMVKLKGHTNYYLGINFGDTWYECKKDEAELPVKFVQRLCANYDSFEKLDWCDSPAEYFKPMILEFKKDRVMDCLKVYSNTLPSSLNLDTILESFENYTVRSYLYDIEQAFIPSIDKDKKSGKPLFDKNKRPVYNKDDMALSGIVTCLLEGGYEDIDLIYDGRHFSIDELIAYKLDVNRRALTEDEDIEIDISLDLEEEKYNDKELEDEDDFWSYTDGEDGSTKFFFVSDYEDEESEMIFTKAEALIKPVEDKFKYVETLGATKVLYVNGYKELITLEKKLYPYIDNKNGKRVKIEYGNQVKVLAAYYNLPSDRDLEDMLVEVNEDKLKRANNF